MKNVGSLSVWRTDSDNNTIYKHCQATGRKRDREMSEKRKKERERERRKWD